MARSSYPRLLQPVDSFAELGCFPSCANGGLKVVPLSCRAPDRPESCFAAMRSVYKGRMARWLLALMVVGMVLRCRAGETATATATTLGGFITSITVTTSGSGYVNAPSVTISGGGGSGGSAKAFITDGKVALIVVLTAGSGYTSSPTVVVEPPPKDVLVEVELVPKLTVDGPPNSTVSIGWAADLKGPWYPWTNVIVGTNGTILVDLAPTASTRFYRPVPSRPGFVWLWPGTFTMGSVTSEAGRASDELRHLVTFTNAFAVCDHEVTQAEYEAVTGTNPSKFKGQDLPVDSVSWVEAVDYCKKLTEMERAAGLITSRQVYRLPTEAEWEYAARAGSTAARHGDLDDIAWWQGNSELRTRPVKTKQPNAWGLYDMIGNLWEWCSDWRGPYSPTPAKNPPGPTSGTDRVERGGSWASPVEHCRAAMRNSFVPTLRDRSVGFRAVLAPAP